MTAISHGTASGNPTKLINQPTNLFYNLFYLFIHFEAPSLLEIANGPFSNISGRQYSEGRLKSESELRINLPRRSKLAVDSYRSPTMQELTSTRSSAVHSPVVVEAPSFKVPAVTMTAISETASGNPTKLNN